MTSLPSAPRFDNIVRSERYFTATLLPAILLNGNLQGLEAFLELIDTNGRRRLGGATERDGLGAPHPRQDRFAAWSVDTVEVITEFHIARDLSFADRLQPSERADSEVQESETERRDAPDLVIVFDDELVVCEAKFFDTVSLHRLDAQLESQRRQVRYLFNDRPRLKTYRHVAILPMEPKATLDCDAVLTWSNIADLAERILTPEHYVTLRLRAAIRYFQELVGEPGEPVPNYDGILPFDVMLEECRSRGDAIAVGHVGGEADLLRRPRQYLFGKPWKWRDPHTNLGVAVPRNWIRGARFAELFTP